MFNAIPIKVPMIYITETDKPNLKFIWMHKRLLIAKVTLNKRSNAGSITISNLQYYRSIATLYWHKNRHEDK
jgi:hypothetical protein